MQERFRGGDALAALRTSVASENILGGWGRGGVGWGGVGRALGAWRREGSAGREAVAGSRAEVRLACTSATTLGPGSEHVVDNGHTCWVKSAGVLASVLPEADRGRVSTQVWGWGG